MGEEGERETYTSEEKRGNGRNPLRGRGGEGRKNCQGRIRGGIRMRSNKRVRAQSDRHKGASNLPLAKTKNTTKKGRAPTLTKRTFAVGA